MYHPALGYSAQEQRPWCISSLVHAAAIRMYGTQALSSCARWDVTRAKTFISTQHCTALRYFHIAVFRYRSAFLGVLIWLLTRGQCPVNGGVSVLHPPVVLGVMSNQSQAHNILLVIQISWIICEQRHGCTEVRRGASPQIFNLSDTQVVANAYPGYLDKSTFLVRIWKPWRRFYSRSATS